MVFRLFWKAIGLTKVKDARDLQLNSPASKQQLLHHYLSGSTTPVGAPGFRDRWQQELDNLGYPDKNKYGIRNISMDNGAIDGTLNGQACHAVLDMVTTLQIRVFFIKINLLQLASSSVAFAGNNGNSCNVFSGWFGIFLNSNHKFATAPSNSKSYDIVPGGTRPAQQELADQGEGYISIPLGLFTSGGINTTFNVYKGDHCFIPLKSALGMNLNNTDLGENLYSRNLICTGETPFDSYYAPFTNEHHNELTTSNVAWIKEEIAGNPQLPTTEHPYAIQLQNGSEPICSSSTYILCPQPTGNVTWTISNPNIATIPSPSNGNSVTVTTVGSGTVTLTATIGNYSATRDIVIGQGNYSGFIAGWDDPAYTGSEQYPYVLGQPGDMGYDWSVLSAPSPYSYGIAGGGTNSIDFTAYEVGLYTLQVKISTACGSYYTWGQVYVYDRYSQFMFVVSPNPSSNTITISPKKNAKEKNSMKSENNDITAIRILDSYGNLKKQLKYNSNTKQAQINIFDLIPGFYYVEISYGQKKERQQLIIQR